MNAKNTAESLEILRKENIKLKNSYEYRIGIKVANAIKSIKERKFIEWISQEKRYRQISKYREGFVIPDTNFEYGDYPNNDVRIVVYTCITGGYDTLQEPLYYHPNIKYIAFTDNNQIKSDLWEIRKINDEVKTLNDNVLINRYYKFHPYELFEEFDYSIYIDGNIKVVSDLRNMVNRINEKTGLAFHRHNSRNCIYKEFAVCKIEKRGNISAMEKQIKKYKEEGFPANFGLYEANVIVCDNKSKEAKIILDFWWKTFLNSESKRDQIALPYVVWKCGFEFDDIGNLGINMHNNPKLIKVYHK